MYSIRTSGYLILLLLGIVAIFLWFYKSQLGIITEAPGVVVPASKVAIVQHLEGGIVKNINIKEGEKITKGEKILSLESISSGSKVEEIKGLIFGHRIDKIRLEAELQGRKTLFYPEDLMQENSLLAKKAIERFKGRKNKLDGLVAAQSELVKQRKAELVEVSARKEKNKQNLKLLNEQIKISKSLLENKLTNKMTHLALLREQAIINGQLNEDTAALIRLRHSIDEAKIRIDSIKNTFSEEVGKELDEKIQALNALLERRQDKEDSLRRTVIRAPVSGTIQKLNYPTIGGVIAPSAVVAEIIPDGETLRVEASLPSQEIGYVHLGQPVQIRLDSADAFRFGEIDGEVISISPDTVKLEGSVPHYKVIISLKSNAFKRSENLYQLVPGVRVVCGIIIGSRSVFEYIFEPFMTNWKYSLTER